jgi:hypothetical protein
MIDLNAANHTNRELELMLAGKKPLAFFCDEIDFYPDDEIFPEQKFQPFVETGRFVRGAFLIEGEFIEKLGRNAQWQFVFFALAEEAWRIPAMIQLIQIRSRTPRMWQSEGLERYESSLLGYTSEEIDAWCDHRFRSRPSRSLNVEAQRDQ